VLSHAFFHKNNANAITKLFLPTAFLTTNCFALDTSMPYPTTRSARVGFARWTEVSRPNERAEPKT
jgi:hypothetical protein